MKPKGQKYLTHVDGFSKGKISSRVMPIST